MCGIVGYLGEKKVKEVLIDGLRTLEYRGYDSAGISIFDGKNIKRVRAAGKLIELENKLGSIDFSGRSGIGHTRWATHGKPTERNAHPHTAQKISLVHNGIIENYLELREELIAGGATISSDTDSELVAHLISKEIETTKDLFAAVKNVKKRLRGAYAVLVMSEDEPDTMIGFKEGPPLLIGRGKPGKDGHPSEILFASDALAIVPHTLDVLYLNDGEIAVVKGKSVSLYNGKNLVAEQKWTVLNWNADVAQKNGFEHYMLKEIFEQPSSFKTAIEAHVDTENHLVELDPASGLTPEVLKNVERFFIVACGTSYYAGLYAKYIIEKYAKIPVELDIASEFRYREPSLPKNSIVAVISQSGETADTLAALRLAKSEGVKVLSLCNTKLSTIDREADYKLYMNSGIEIGVASTKAFTSSLGVLALLGLFAGKCRGFVDKEKEQKYVRSLLGLSAQMESVLVCSKFFEEASESFKKFKGFLYMGRGPHYAIALEGALKMKELAYRHAEGYAAGEMKHGPLALIDEDMLIFMICPKDHLYEKTLSNLEEAKARGGYIVSMGTLEDEKLKALSEQYLSLPEGNEITNPILETLPVQLLSYHVSKALGNDVDQPRNLAKSVTVE
jgi:glucosamine--fructose-6-phosphate aminotransferase (isomerizing)